MSVRAVPPAAPTAAVCEAFELVSFGAPFRPAGADSENWPAVRVDGSHVVVRFECYTGPIGFAAAVCARLAGIGAPVAAPVVATGGLDLIDDDGVWSVWERI